VRALARIVAALAAFNAVVGKAFSWLALGVVLVCFAVVVLRYGFNYGQVWMQDLYVWMSAVMFTGVAGFTFLKDSHVRVDIFYRPASIRYKAWADLIGFFIFLLPFTVVVLVWSWLYVAGSWQIAESSRNADGLPGFYVVKTFVLLFCVFLQIHGLAMVGRSILILKGREDLVPESMKYEGM